MSRDMSYERSKKMVKIGKTPRLYTAKRPCISRGTGGEFSVTLKLLAWATMYGRHRRVERPEKWCYFITVRARVRVLQLHREYSHFKRSMSRVQETAFGRSGGPTLHRCHTRLLWQDSRVWAAPGKS